MTLAIQLKDFPSEGVRLICPAEPPCCCRNTAGFTA